ncbi:hypothetical protein Tco_0254418, partial [Tanacetum coccineum]
KRLHDDLEVNIAKVRVTVAQHNLVLNKPDLDTMSFDDLYNNFKIVEQEYCCANTQVSPTSTQVRTTSTQVSTANLSDDTVYAFLASQPNGSELVYEDLEQIHEDDIEEIDLK